MPMSPTRPDHFPCVLTLADLPRMRSEAGLK